MLIYIPGLAGPSLMGELADVQILVKPRLTREVVIHAQRNIQRNIFNVRSEQCFSSIFLLKMSVNGEG
jgi:hypothetical protein